MAANTYPAIAIETKYLEMTKHFIYHPGNGGDSLRGHNNIQFSTKDRDNDAYSLSCAIAYTGAWWYTKCHASNLNGLYLNGSTKIYAKGVVWRSWKGYYYSLKRVEMKIRPREV